MKTAMSMTLMEMEHVPDVVATCPNNLYESPVRGMDPRPLKYRKVAYASFKKRLSSQHSGEGDEAERRGSGPTVVAAHGCRHGLSRWEAYDPAASPWFPIRRIIGREQYPSQQFFRSISRLEVPASCSPTVSRSSTIGAV